MPAVPALPSPAHQSQLWLPALKDTVLGYVLVAISCVPRYAILSYRLLAKVKPFRFLPTRRFVYFAFVYMALELLQTASEIENCNCKAFTMRLNNTLVEKHDPSG